MAVFIFGAPMAYPQARLTTIDQVLDRYKQALGGVDAIKNVTSETRPHAEVLEVAEPVGQSSHNQRR
jgi:hypothetical protein